MQLFSPIVRTISWEEIRYSQVWEDGLLVNRALDILPTDTVVSIGSGGCNILEMLLRNPEKIYAIDLSPAQHALLNLRFTAIEKLDFKTYESLMGVSAPDQAVHTYRKIRPNLLPSTRNYFDANEQLIAGGLIHQGRLEKYFSYFRTNALAKVWSVDFINALHKSESLDAQTLLLQKGGRLTELRDLAVRYFDQQGLSQARDPEQMKYVTLDNLGLRLFDRFIKVLTQQRLCRNPYMYYFITGKLPPNDQRNLPWREENFAILKSHIGRIDLRLTDMESFLSKMADGSLNKLNLSDIFEYLSPEHSQALFELIEKKLPSGGRVSYWSLFVDRRPQQGKLLRMSVGAMLDRVWFYDDFHAYLKT